mmetsp:Transcript_26509/g.47595  ORF Transcript_26509/g.47595 Transcript_26509/m.47595 type:complete len:239 (+) Transcript_26509:948-1664(+)
MLLNNLGFSKDHISPKDRLLSEKREAAQELRKFKENLHHKKYSYEQRRIKRLVTNEERLAKATDDYLEELRRRKYGLKPKTPPQIMFFDFGSSTSAPSEGPQHYVVDETDFKLPEIKKVAHEEKKFTLVDANGTVLKLYIAGDSSSSASMSPKKGSLSSRNSTVVSLKPNFAVGRDDSTSVERSKVKFRMQKYWQLRVRPDFSPVASQRKKVEVDIKAELSHSPVRRRFHLVKLSDLV